MSGMQPTGARQNKMPLCVDITAFLICGSQTVSAEHFQSFIVGLSAVELVKCAAEYRVFPGYAGKQGHGRVELHRVSSAVHQINGVTVTQRKNSFGDLREPMPEDGMSKVGFRFLDAVYAVEVGVEALPETFKLREDEPYPVALLAPRTHFREGVGVGRFLYIQEAPETGGVIHFRHLLFL